MNTPITDAAVFAPGMGQQSEELVNADLARQLERDRARLMEAALWIFNNSNSLNDRRLIERLLPQLEIKDKP